MGKNENVFWHQADITREDRERVNGHKGATIWLTGLSAVRQVHHGGAA